MSAHDPQSSPQPNPDPGSDPAARHHDHLPASSDAAAVGDPGPSGVTPLDYAIPERAARTPLAELLVLALPTVAQMASYTVMNFTDTWMLSLLENPDPAARRAILEPTAAANASLFGFAIVSVGFGTMWVVNTLVSQAFGRDDKRACGQYMWQGIWFALAFGLLMFPLLPIAEPLFLGFGHEPRLAFLEAQYLWITLSFTAFRLAGAAVGQFLLAIDKPGKVLIAAAIGSSVNIFANWVLIFGHFGLPAMGLAGAAWGTNIGGMVELGVLVWFVTRRNVRVYNVADWRLRWERLRVLLRVGLPSGLQLIGDVLAWAVFGMLVMAVFGTGAMAANTFMMRYMSMSFMPAFGISAAVTALVGRYIGRGRPDIALARAHLGFKVTTIYMLACGAAFLAFRYPMIGLFTDDPLVLRWGAMLMLFAAVYQLFDALYIVYSGALRGAGDTLVPAVVTALLCWVMVVGLGYGVAVWLPGLGLSGPWTIATLYGVILGLFMWFRFRTGNWRHIRLERDPTGDTLPDPAAVPVGSDRSAKRPAAIPG